MNIPISWIKEYVDLPEDLKVFTDKMSMIGHMLDKQFEREGDTVIDLELRGNRADCYAILGIARESHASFGGRFTIPEVKLQLPSQKYPDFDVVVEHPDVHRFYSVIISNVKVGPSPEWMQQRLRAYGMEVINNVVDITNYVMLETGMPMHAFDLKNMRGSKLILRAGKKGDSFHSFDETDVQITENDIVFGTEDGGALGLAGIVGGIESGISNDTTDILLECAAYDRATIRKSMFYHKSMTEAGLRHSHDLHASLCDYALPRAAELVLELAQSGSTEITGANDHYPNPEQPRTILFNPSEVTRLGGVEVPTAEQKAVLERLEFNVEEKDGKLEVTVPLFRTDVVASEDIVEEVLRIWGYEKIPSKTLSSVIPKPLIQPEVIIEEQSRDIMIAQGVDEIITVPFVHEPMFAAMEDPLQDRAIAIVNPPTSLHTHMRTTMFVEHLTVAHKILARGDEEVAVFEIGKVYMKKEGEQHQAPHKKEFPYLELRQLTATFASKKKKWDYYKVKGIVENYLDRIGVKNSTFTRYEGFPYSTAALIKQGDRVLGSIGLLNQVMTRSVFHIEEDIYGFVLDIEEITHAEKVQKSFVPYSQYPAVVLDMSVVIQKSVQAGDMIQKVKEIGGELLREVSIQDVYEKGDNERSILLTIHYQSKDRNLTTEEVNQKHQEIATALQESFNAVIQGKIISQ